MFDNERSSDSFKSSVWRSVKGMIMQRSEFECNVESVSLRYISDIIYSNIFYTVFQKKWRQNWNHYNYGTPYQN